MPLYPMRFAFTPGKNDRVEAVVAIPEETRSIVHGTIYDAEGNKVKNAIVRLFLCEDNKRVPVSHGFTDEEGEFIFGPLHSNKNYLVKVYTNGVTLREMTLRPRKKKTKI